MLEPFIFQLSRLEKAIILGIFYQMLKENNYEKVNSNISYILILKTGK